MEGSEDLVLMEEELRSSRMRVERLEKEIMEYRNDRNRMDVEEEEDLERNLRRTCGKAAEDIEKAVNEGVAAGNALRRARRRNRMARVMLCFSNVGTLSTGALLIALGAQQSQLDGEEDQIVQDPNHLLLVMGIMMCISALSGVMGALFARKMFGKAFLYVHSAIAIFVGCALLWGGIVSFAWPNHAQENFNTFVEDNPQVAQVVNKTAEVAKEMTVQLNNTLPEDVAVVEDNIWTTERLEDEYADHTVLGGILCFVGAFLMMLELLVTGAAIPEAPRLTLRRLMLSTSWVGVMLSLCLAVLSIVVGVQGGDEYGSWAAWLVAMASFVVGFVSILGIYGVKSRSILALILHLFLMSTANIVLVMGAVLSFALPQQTKDFVHEHWDALEEYLYKMDEAATVQAVDENMDLIGIGSLVLACLLFLNICASFGTIAEFARERRRTKRHITD